MPEPPEGVELSTKLVPPQTGLLLVAVILGALSVDTDTLVEAVAVQPALSVTVTRYVPAFAMVIGKPGGSSTVELKLAGPVQLKVE